MQNYFLLTNRLFNLAIFERLQLVNKGYGILCEINFSFDSFHWIFSALCRSIIVILKMCMKKFDAEKIFLTN